MSDQLPQSIPQEALGRAYMQKQEAPARPGSADPIEQANIRVAVRMREKFDEGHWERSLEIPTAPKYEAAKVDAKVQQIGSERDPNSGQIVRNPGSAEAQRFNDASVFSSVLGRVIENGIDSPLVTDNERNAVAFVVRDAILRNPVLAREYDALGLHGPAAQMEFLIKHIKDPRFMAEVRREADKIANSPDIPDNVGDLRDNLSGKELDMQTVQEEIAEIDHNIASINRRLREFNSGAGAGGAMGGRALELQQARNDLAQAKRDVAGLTGAKDAAAQEVQDLQAEMSIVRARGYNGARTEAEVRLELSQAQGRLRTATSDLSRRQVEIDTLNSSIPGFEAERVNLAQHLQEYRRERAEKQKELNKLTVEVNKGRRTLADAINMRDAMEQQLVERLRNVWGEAATTLVNQDMRALAQTWREAKDAEFVDLKSGASKAGREHIAKVLDMKVDKKGWLGRKEKVTVINKNKTREITTMIIDQGPEYAAKSILLGTINPETGVKYTRDEVNALVADHTFMAEFQPMMIKEVFGRKVLSSGKFNPEEVRKIVTSDWGETMIQQAMEHNQEIKDKIEAVYGADAMSKPGAAKRFARELSDPKNVGLAALLGLATAFTGGIAGPIAAGSWLSASAGVGAYRSGKGYSPVFG